LLVSSTRIADTLDDCCTRWKWASFQIATNPESLSRPLQPGVRFHPEQE
jgi:hypothetical protein